MQKQQIELSQRDQINEERDPLNLDSVGLQELGNFKIQPSKLWQIYNLSQRRKKAEELDYLIEQGGVGWLMEGLQTSIKDGIKGDVQQRIQVYGHNKRELRPPKSYCELLLNALEDFIMRVLIGAAIVSIVIEVSTADADHRSTAWIEGFAILIAVIVCTNVAAANDYSKEQQFLKLNAASEKSKMVTVLRNGEMVVLHEEECLTGDICRLVEGMEIPADGVIIEGSEIRMDESSMTGETHSIKKDTIEHCLRRKRELEAEGMEFNEQERFEVPSPALLSGTKVLEGEGLFVVCVVGDNSCLGKIKASLEQEEEEQTPLQEKLTIIADDIGKFGLYSAILIVIVLLIRFAIERGIDESWDHSKHWLEMLNFVILGIVVLIVAIPEGLPLSVTISLAYSVQKMMNDKNLVRKMYACETMGGADAICSDKTGTLTMNKMTLTKVWNQKYYDIDIFAQQQELRALMNPSMHQLFAEAICCNSSAELHPQQGSKTEIAFLEYISKANYDYHQLRQAVQYLQRIPFNSSRKRMSVIVETKHNGLPQRRLYIKGASEILVKCISTIHGFDDQKVPISSTTQNQIEQIISEMARQSLRTICVAYRDLDGSEDLASNDGKVYDIEKSQLTFLGLMGIMDNLREGVKDAVTRCKAAGIKVRMVTGDNSETARAIAVQCGIIESGDSRALVLDGAAFVEKIGGVVCKNCQIEQCKCARNMSEAKKQNIPLRVDTIGKMDVFKSLYPNIAVLARSRPTDKYAMIVGLKECEHVVAVTGDGTNDAPALKKADVGFAMGIAGTQVAKDASAIILMEDNFTDIVKAVMWGRNIFQSIRKFLQFQLTVNVVAVMLTLITSAILKQEILKPIQMLWVNLIMDSFASLALATEPPSLDLLQEKPYKRNQSIITQKMTKHIAGQSIYQMVAILICVFLAPDFLPEYRDDFDNEIENWMARTPNYANSDIWHPKYNLDYYPDELYARSGTMRTISGEVDYEDAWDEFRVPSRHYTFIYNTFVMMQIFNFVSCRKLNDEINIFHNICNNSLFAFMVFLIFGCQIILVTFGSLAFSCYSFYGLTIIQWLICVAFGFGGWIVSLLLKFIPENKLCPQASQQTKPELHHQHSGVLELRRGSSMNRSQRRQQNQIDIVHN